MKKFHKKERTAGKDPIALELERTRDEIAQTLMNFNSVTQDELLDFYTYRLKAAEVKYSHLIKVIRAC